MGVDSIDNPTMTRIPKRARVTYSGVYLGTSLFDFPTAATACGAPDFLNNQVEVMEAFAPSYSLRKTIAEYSAPPLENFRIQMHWSTAREDRTELPTWPGYAGGTPTFNIGRITRKGGSVVSIENDGKPDRVVQDDGNGPENMTVNYNTQYTPEEGWPFYAPAPFSYSNFFQECREFPTGRQGELSLICGGFFGDKNDPTVEAIFTHPFLGSVGLSGYLQPVWHKDLSLQWKLHSFPIENNPNRLQRICVIPESVQFTVADAIKFSTGVMENASNYGGKLDRLVIDVDFEDWFEGPLASLP